MSTSTRLLSSGLNLNNPSHYVTRSPEETMALGNLLGKDLPANSVLCFFGNLAAGKTTFIKGLCQGVAGVDSELVSSPTFVYLNIYKGKKTVYHFDLYRLRDVDEFLSMGFEEFFFMGGVCCIEWPERIAQILPENCIKIMMEHTSTSEEESARTITIS